MRFSSTGLKEFKGEHAFFKKIKKIFYLLASEHLFTTSNANTSTHTSTLATSRVATASKVKSYNKQASKQRTNKQTIVIINNNNSNNNNNNNK